MRILKVFIEIAGMMRPVGRIVGNDSTDAKFQYEKEYMDSSFGRPISISLPFQSEEFSAVQTKNYFEGIITAVKKKALQRGG